MPGIVIFRRSNYRRNYLKKQTMALKIKTKTAQLGGFWIHKEKS
jgi:hypothetical protein